MVHPVHLAFTLITTNNNHSNSIIIYMKFLGIQIHFTGQAHWVTSAFIGGEVRLYDSCVSTVLPKSLKEQLKDIYQIAAKDGCLIISEMPVQQQTNSYDCGLFAIAFALHLAGGDEPSAVNFNCSRMRQHLIKCFEDELLLPFPTQVEETVHCTKRIRKICI